MSEPSDWDPLPPPADDGLRQRPAPTPMDPAAAAQAEQALAALRQRIAADARPVRSDLRPEELPLAVEYRDGRDLREDQEWFRRLPAREQQRLHREWQLQHERLTLAPWRWDRRLLRGAAVGAGVFLATSLLQAPLLGFGPMPWMLVAGAVAGALMRCTQRGRFQCSLVAAATYLAFMVFPMVVLDGSIAGVLGQVLPVLGGLVIVTWAGGLVGFDFEVRQSGGFERREPPAGHSGSA